jgi:hypothetical protein
MAGNWGTQHLETALFVFADGSVHPLAVSIPGPILGLLLLPTDGQAINYQF